MKSMGWSLAYSEFERTAQCNASGGSMSERLRAELACLDEAFAANSNRISERIYEARVAVRLSPRQAHYSEALGKLYFVDDRDRTIERSVRSVFTGLGSAYECTRISTDVHGFFDNGRRVRVPSNCRIPVFAALRFLGVRLK